MATMTIVSTLFGLLLAAGLVFVFRPRDRSPVQLIVGVVLVAGMFWLSTPSYGWAKSTVKTQAISNYTQFFGEEGTSHGADTTVCKKVKEDETPPCRNNEDCDSYLVNVPETYTDEKGNLKSRDHWVTKWHHCPKGSEEYSYWIMDTHGAKHYFTDRIFGPGTRHLRGNIRSIASTPPSKYQSLTTLIDQGVAVELTFQNKYTNYIIGSDKEGRDKWKEEISQLQKAHLLPDPVFNPKSPVYDTVYADKMTFTCMDRPADYAAWQNYLTRFDSRLGIRLQGDMHVAVIKASCLTTIGMDPEHALGAIRAHWMYDYGKDAFAKNGIMLLLAVDDTGTTIKWSRAETGMPKGNEAMLEALKGRLRDTPFNSSSVFGLTTATISPASEDGITWKTEGGIIPQIVFEDHVFKRICMECKGVEDEGQTSYIALTDLIEPGGWAITGFLAIDLLIGAVAAGIFLAAYCYFAGASLRFSQYSRH